MRRFITSADDEIGKRLHCSWVQCLWRLFFHSLTVSWTYECSHKARRWIDEFVRRSSIIGCVPRDHSDSDVSCATWGSIFGSDVQTFQTLPDIWVWSTRNKRMSGCFWALYAMSSGQTPRLSFGLVEPNVGYVVQCFSGHHRKRSACLTCHLLTIAYHPETSKLVQMDTTVPSRWHAKICEINKLLPNWQVSNGDHLTVNQESKSAPTAIICSSLRVFLAAVQKVDV